MPIIRVRHWERLEPECIRVIMSYLLHLCHNERDGVSNHRPTQRASNTENVSIWWRQYWYHWPYCESSDARRNDQWYGALMFSLLLARTRYWPNSRVFGDLRHHVTVCNGMGLLKKSCSFQNMMFYKTQMESNILSLHWNWLNVLWCRILRAS